MTHEAFMRDARDEANTASTRVRAAFDAMYECCKQLTELQGPPEVVVGSALLILPLPHDDKNKVRELCTWTLHVAPLEPLPMSAANATELAVRVHNCLKA